MRFVNVRKLQTRIQGIERGSTKFILVLTVNDITWLTDMEMNNDLLLDYT